LKFSFFVALYMTVIVFSMFLPVITATQTVEDSDNTSVNGITLKAYVEGYYDSNDNDEFFKVYHEAKLTGFVSWYYVDESSWEFCGREVYGDLTWDVRYIEDGETFSGTIYEWYQRGTDWPNSQDVNNAYTYAWARFKSFLTGETIERSVKAEVTAPGFSP
ncbi:MAG: hypothetical protein ACP6IU_14600, partial [Candidatus Asgardarchaeia archaeon]